MSKFPSVDVRLGMALGMLWVTTVILGFVLGMWVGKVFL
jgi:hypothetical protein